MSTPGDTSNGVSPGIYVDRAKKFLKEHRLIKVERERDEKGRLGKTYVTLLNMPKSSSIKNSPPPDFSNAGKKGTNAYKEQLEVLKKKKKKTSMLSSRPEADPVAGSPQSNQETIPEVKEYKDLQEPPFNLSTSKIQKLLSELEGAEGYTLRDYCSWWKANYHDKGKASNCFALILRAMQWGWELGDYSEWGLQEAYG